MIGDWVGGGKESGGSASGSRRNAAEADGVPPREFREWRSRESPEQNAAESGQNSTIGITVQLKQGCVLG